MIEMINTRGNNKRIMEAHKGGLGECTIAGIFQDEGININATHVKAVIEMEAAGYSKKAMPKKAVKDAVAFKNGTGDEKGTKKE
jgi:hypothetical protein